MPVMISKLIIKLEDQFSAQARGISKAVGNLEGAIGRNNRALGQARMGMVDAVAAGYALARAFGAPVRLAADFEKQMKLTAVASEATNAQLSEMTSLARQLGGATAFTATDAGKAMEELAKAGLNADQILHGAVKATLDMASATGSDLPASAKLAAQMVESFGVKVEDMTGVVQFAVGAMAKSKFDFSDIVDGFGQAAGVAADAGVSYQEFLTTLAGGADLFSSGSDAGTSFKNFLQFLVPKSDAAAGMIDKLGLSFFDASGKLKDMADIAQQLQDALAPLSQKDRIDALHTIFGTDTSRSAIALSRLGRSGFLELLKELGSTDVAAYASAHMDGFWGTVEKLSGALQDLGIALGGPFNNGLVQAINTALPLIDGMTKWADANPGLTAGIMDVVGGLVALRIASAAASFAFLWLRGGALGATLVGLRAVGLAMGAGGLAASLGVLGVAAAAAGGAGYLLYQHWDQVKAVAGKVGNGLAMVAKRAVTTAKHFGGSLWKRGVAAVQRLRTALFGDGTIRGGGGSNTLLGSATGDHISGVVQRHATALAASLKAARNLPARDALGRFVKRAATEAASVAQAAAPAIHQVSAAVSTSTARFDQLLHAIRGAGDGMSVYTHKATALGAALNLLNHVGDRTVAMVRHLAGPVLELIAPYARAAAPFLRLASRLNLLATAATFVVTHLKELRELGDGIGQGFASWLPSIGDSGEHFKTAWADAGKALQGAIDQIGTSLNQVFGGGSWERFGESVGSTLGGAAKVAAELGAALGDIVHWSADVIAFLTKLGGDFYSGNFSQYIRDLGNGAKELANFTGVSAAIDAIGTALSKLGADIAAFVQNNMLVDFLGKVQAAAEKVAAVIGGAGSASSDAAAAEGGLPPAIPANDNASAAAAATASMNAYTAAMTAAGAAAVAEATSLGSRIVSALNVTARPTVDTSSISGAKAQVDALFASLQKLPGAVAVSKQVGGGLIPGAAPTRPSGSFQARASGGPIRAGVPYLVGEHGEEMIVPDRPGFVLDARRTAAITSGRGGIFDASYWDEHAMRPQDAMFDHADAIARALSPGATAATRPSARPASTSPAVRRSSVAAAAISHGAEARRAAAAHDMLGGPGLVAQTEMMERANRMAATFIPAARAAIRGRSTAGGGSGGATVTTNHLNVNVTVHGAPNMSADEMEKRFGRSVGRALRSAFADGTV